MLLSETPDRDGKRVTMTVYLGSNPDPLREGVEVKIKEKIYKNVTEKSLRYWLLINWRIEHVNFVFFHCPKPLFLSLL